MAVMEYRVVTMTPLTSDEQTAVLALWTTAERLVFSNYPGLDGDDLRQEAFFGLVRAVRTWQDFPSGRTLISWAKICVWSAVGDAIRRELGGHDGTSRRMAMKSIASLSVANRDALAVSADTETVDIQDEIAFMERQLTVHLRSTFRLYAAGVSQADIARHDGCTINNIGYRLGQIGTILGWPSDTRWKRRRLG